MLKIRYAVIILNYNTINDAFEACRSVIDNANHDDFVICIADNASTNAEDRRKIENFRCNNVITIRLTENKGYACGNNSAVEFVLMNYDPDYIVIMNPDVKIINNGTLDKMLDRIDQEGSECVGGQPLVWNYHYGERAEMQQNIRRVPTFFDCCIISSFTLRLIFRKRYNKFTYDNLKPYVNEEIYFVPSGAFFVINNKFFQDIGMFDPNTFLYSEEFILGYKLREKGYHLLFMPQFKVKHEHGKSTGFNKYKISKKSSKYALESRLYYAKTYLRIGKIRCTILTILHWCNYAARIVVANVFVRC